MIYCHERAVKLLIRYELYRRGQKATEELQDACDAAYREGNALLR
jgi:hypothetical protein